VSFSLRFTEAAIADIERLYDYLLERGDWTPADRAIDVIASALELLALAPFACRKASAETPLLRELLIAFGGTGYVLLYRIGDAETLTISAVRHQREDDYFH